MTTNVKPDNVSTEHEIPRTNHSETVIPKTLKDSGILSSSEPSDKLSPGLYDLLTRIISSDLNIISVQKDAPDPTKEEKIKFLNCLFQEKPTQFLYRYLPCIKVSFKYV